MVDSHRHVRLGQRAARARGGDAGNQQCFLSHARTHAFVHPFDPPCLSVCLQTFLPSSTLVYDSTFHTNDVAHKHITDTSAKRTYERHFIAQVLVVSSLADYLVVSMSSNVGRLLMEQLATAKRVTQVRAEKPLCRLKSKLKRPALASPCQVSLAGALGISFDCDYWVFQAQRETCSRGFQVEPERALFASQRPRDAQTSIS